MQNKDVKAGQGVHAQGHSSVTRLPHMEDSRRTLERGDYSSKDIIIRTAKHKKKNSRKEIFQRCLASL